MYMPIESTTTEVRKTFTAGGQYGYETVTIKDLYDTIRIAESRASADGIDTTYDDWAHVTAGDGQIIVSYKVEG